MNTEQIRHAKSIARHLHNHLSHLQSVIGSLESSSNATLESIPVDQVARTFREGVDWHTLKLNEVLNDMLPELEE